MRIRADVVAAVLVLLIGAPYVFVLARGFAEGEQRRREVPLRSLMGDEGYEAWVEYQRFDEGEAPALHYLGDNRLAPDFTLKAADGTPWTLSEQRGKTVVMNFWTITCQPCVEEMPALEQLAKVAAERDDLEVVAVSTDAGWDEVSGVFGPDTSLEVLFDPDRSVVRDKFGTRLYPETWVIGPDGRIRLRIDGKRDWASPLALDAIELAVN